jgi:hypothetical protein
MYKIQKTKGLRFWLLILIKAFLSKKTGLKSEKIVSIVNIIRSLLFSQMVKNNSDPKHQLIYALTPQPVKVSKVWENNIEIDKTLNLA